MDPKPRILEYHRPERSNAIDWPALIFPAVLLVLAAFLLFDWIRSLLS